MRRPWALPVGAVLGGIMAMGCGSSTAAGPSTTTPRAESYVGSPLSWLSVEARSWNKRLNDDQAVIDSASVTSPEVGASAYFARLASACTQLADDARLAGQIPTAPSRSLATAWRAMTVHTESYASDCLVLTRTHSSVALTRWNESLKAMDAANGSLNSVVATVRGTSGGSAG